MLLLGHILILLGGVYLLVGQVRAPPIPPPHPTPPGPTWGSQKQTRIPLGIRVS